MLVYGVSRYDDCNDKSALESQLLPTTTDN